MLGAGRARAGKDKQRGDGTTWGGSRAHLPIHLRSQLSQDPGDRSQAGTYWSAKRSEARTRRSQETKTQAEVGSGHSPGTGPITQSRTRPSPELRGRVPPNPFLPKIHN